MTRAARLRSGLSYQPGEAPWKTTGRSTRGIEVPCGVVVAVGVSVGVVVKVAVPVGVTVVAGTFWRIVPLLPTIHASPALSVATEFRKMVPIEPVMLAGDQVVPSNSRMVPL